MVPATCVVLNQLRVSLLGARGILDAVTATLYEWVGEGALERLIDAFYDGVQADDLLAGFFPGRVSARTAITSSLGG